MEVNMELQDEIIERTDTVPSLRLDAVLGSAFNLSRTKAAELIAANRVSIDDQPCLKPSKELKVGTLITIRGIGSARLLETGGTSKKGRLFIKTGRYRSRKPTEQE